MFDCGLREIADGADPDVVARVEKPKEIAADPAEAEDSDARHGIFLPHHGKLAEIRGTGGDKDAGVPAFPTSGGMRERRPKDGSS